jgi:diguanylate cyclase (GGDEF)-like protein
LTKPKTLSVTTSHSRDLLLALSRAAQSVQRARTEEEVYHAVGDQIKSLGEEAALYIVTDERRMLALAHTTYAPKVVKSVKAFLLGERIHKGIETLRIETEKGTASITLSAGVAGHDPLDASVEDIIRRADQALYAAKQAGRNRTVVFDAETGGSA